MSEFGPEPWSRFSDGYAAYMFASPDGEAVCLCCSFVPGATPDDRGSYVSSNLGEFCRHIMRHIGALHPLPPGLCTLVRNRWATDITKEHA